MTLPSLEDFLAKYIALESVSLAPRPGAMEKTAQFLVNHLQAMNFFAEIVPIPDGHPIVFAHRRAASPRIRLLLYGHYDVQPADPLEKWETDPFQLTVEDGIAHGRGVADDKGPMAAMLYGLADAGMDDAIDITVVIEGEEEIGSPHVEEFLKDKQICADAVLIADTGSISDDIPALTTGLRSIVSFELTLRTGLRDLHSGFGGALPNAIHELTRLCAKLHNKCGRVAVNGFYEDVTPPTKQEHLTFQFLEDFEVPFPEAMGTRAVANFFPLYLPRSIHAFMPSLEINGIRGGSAKTIIPAEASANITARVANGQNPQKIAQLVEQFIRRHAPKYADLTLAVKCFGAPYAIDFANVSSTFLELFYRMEHSIETAYGKAPLHLREGGSIGIVDAFKSICGADSILVGAVPPDAQIHSPNEHISMEILYRIQRMFKKFFSRIRLGNFTT
ncbi:MAG: M20/M25/M40 family metallo-hydrolase [Puniceicoccales bacterium]|jgi:acetylornithine deacetylase/succinyl-diaminopimelate desuccinylase-like protein|nr:M20/M25/M40 family metallo-hydrolase [Puniceicoccales bacterium]